MIGKCNTGGGENLTTQLNNQDAIITELEAKVQSVFGVDMATPVNAQTLTIEQIQESLVGKAQGANATAETILKGFSAYVGQELVEGAFDKSQCLDALLAGDFTVGAVDKFTFAKDMRVGSFGYNGNHVPLNHSLGTLPRMAILTGKDITKNGAYYILTTVTLALRHAGDYYQAMYKAIGESYAPDRDGTITVITNCDSRVQNSDTQVAICLGSCYLEGGKEYTLITMA